MSIRWFYTPHNEESVICLLECGYTMYEGSIQNTESGLLIVDMINKAFLEAFTVSNINGLWVVDLSDIPRLTTLVSLGMEDDTIRALLKEGKK